MPIQSNQWPGRYYNTLAQVLLREPGHAQRGRRHRQDWLGSLLRQRIHPGRNGTRSRAHRQPAAARPREPRLRCAARPDGLGQHALRQRAQRQPVGRQHRSAAIFGQVVRGTAGSERARPRHARPAARPDRRRVTCISPLGNGAGSLLYDTENLVNYHDVIALPRQHLQPVLPARLAHASTAPTPTTIVPRVNKAYEDKGLSHVHDVERRTTAASSSSATRSNVAMNAQPGRHAPQAASQRSQRQAPGPRQLRPAPAAGGQQRRPGVHRQRRVSRRATSTTNITAKSSEQTIKNEGFLAGTSLDFKDRYIVDGAFRYDGSSLFGSGNRWAPFGRISGVWRVSEEPFWHLNFITDFRLRASHGTAGSTPRFIAQYETYNCSTTGCSLGQAGNTKLKPETTTENEFGTDFTLFNRLGVELTQRTVGDEEPDPPGPDAGVARLHQPVAERRNAVQQHV